MADAQRGLNRRAVLRMGGLALVGAGLGGCAARAPRAAPMRLVLPPIAASWDRIIRTTVGLRPHRPPGFNLSAERLDAKTVIHNYGHGGAGHSLAWGTGLLAAELALGHADRRAAVIGCGTVGLTAARQLQRRGFAVTIYTLSVPPDTTSNMALAGFTPTSGLVSTEVAPEWEAQFKRAVEAAYRELQIRAGPESGVSWIDNYSIRETPEREQPVSEFRIPEANSLLPPDVQPSAGQVVFGPGEHPFPGKYAVQRKTLRIEPSIYLDALVREFLAYGGRLVIRKFDAPRDLMSLEESLIVNCTGLGSRALFADETMTPVKGQLVVLVPQPEIDYACRMMPRRDGIALGSTQERGVWTLEPNDAERTRVVENVIKFYSAMRQPPPGARPTRAEPARAIPPAASFFGDES